MKKFVFFFVVCIVFIGCFQLDLVVLIGILGGKVFYLLICDVD